MITDKFVIILSLLFVSLFSQSQPISGKLIDSETKEPLEFVNIGIIGKNVGTVSDEKGNFSITLDAQYDKDTLKISMIGYKSLTFEVVHFKKKPASNNNILILKLDKSITSLSEVIIKPKKYVTKILGNTANSSSMVGGFTSNDLGSELGTVMKIKKAPAFIENANFNISINNYDSVTFRVNVYKMHDGIPAENILKESIIVTTKMKRGTLTVDLKKYNLVVDDDFFVSIEWIKDLKGTGLYFCGGVFNEDSFSRKTSQGTWTKVPTIGLGINTTITYEK